MHLNSCELYDYVCICQVIIYDDNNIAKTTELSVVSAFNAVQHVNSNVNWFIMLWTRNSCIMKSMQESNVLLIVNIFI